jgi:hypothetical protein
MGGWAVNDEMGRIWKEAVTAYSRKNYLIRRGGGGGGGGVGGEKLNQKVRIGGAAAKIRTGSQLQVPILTTQPSWSAFIKMWTKEVLLLLLLLLIEKLSYYWYKRIILFKNIFYLLKFTGYTPYIFSNYTSL